MFTYNKPMPRSRRNQLGLFGEDNRSKAFSETGESNVIRIMVPTEAPPVGFFETTPTIITVTGNVTVAGSRGKRLYEFVMLRAVAHILCNM